MGPRCNQLAQDGTRIQIDEESDADKILREGFEKELGDNSPFQHLGFAVSDPELMLFQMETTKLFSKLKVWFFVHRDRF